MPHPGTPRLGLGPVRAIRRPGFCLGYNSYGAGASVNHLHFQSFVPASPCRCWIAALPTTAAPSPTHCPASASPIPPKPGFNSTNCTSATPPYNLIYSLGCLRLVARVPQDSGKLSAQSHGYGWSEMAGAVTHFSREAFEGLSAGEFEMELSGFAP